MAASEPWHFGPEPVYKPNAGEDCTLVSLPKDLNPASFHTVDLFHGRRKEVLREWGKQREGEMHRPPQWCMDQLCSGSGLFPPRHLADEWFSADEQRMIRSLEQHLARTGHASMLARDIMALRIYDIDVRIIADDSGSMQNGMIGGYGRPGTVWSQYQVQKVFGRRAFKPVNLAVFNLLNDCPFGPTTPRWDLLKDHLMKWEELFTIMGIQRQVYFLNKSCDTRGRMADLLRDFRGGGTPMGSTFARVLSDYSQQGRDRPLLILALTDGEANDKDAFNDILDEIQDGVHGDVQVCLMGLSLEPEDIEWFEDEECDDTRIRTIEAWEVEQQMILYRKVIPRVEFYSFDMHVYRALVTNYFPADYDYEAPIQTLRHRLYITLHALDRRFTGQRDATRPGSVGSTTGIPLVFPIAGFLLGSVMQGCLCGVVGLLAGAGLAATRRPQRLGAGSVHEESLSEQDDGLIGSFVQDLQRRSVQTESRYLGRTGISNFFQNRRYAPRPQINSAELRRLQYAVGALSPNEVQMRDLQFQNVAFNNTALKAALDYLRSGGFQ